MAPCFLVFLSPAAVFPCLQTTLPHHMVRARMSAIRAPRPMVFFDTRTDSISGDMANVKRIERSAQTGSEMLLRAFKRGDGSILSIVWSREVKSRSRARSLLRTQKRCSDRSFWLIDRNRVCAYERRAQGGNVFWTDPARACMP
ncbi:hypothetical protein BCR44DRAFT_27125 [Catenaria anguillulae PL171]|uniref:Secreted protein n=1 Tax=Catenaria anguillulae PL171 TaxID=765915 RepID=A0A1Y2HPD1_9FUNG|nr:hypothetical protein BCR44DRAFT_27125 [Catenaria anguillulae PL171]